MHPHKEILERIGRTTEVAKILGVPPQRISQFKQIGIPWKFRSMLADAATFKMPPGFLRPNGDL